VVIEPGPRDRPRLYRIEIDPQGPTIPDDAKTGSSAEIGPGEAASGGSDVPDVAGAQLGGGVAVARTAPATLSPISGPEPGSGSAWPGSKDPGPGPHPCGPLRDPEPRPRNVGIVGIVGTGPEGPEKADSEPTIGESESSGSTAGSSEPAQDEEVETWTA
jgi:hypothetical protein